MTDFEQASVCPNCDNPAPDSYCSKCGQRQGSLRPTLIDWLRQTMNELFLVESRLPRTLAALARPGRLTAAWIHGKRATYIPPFRLYLFAAAAFFFLLPPAQNDAIVERIRETLSGVEDGIQDARSANRSELPPAKDVETGARRLAELLPRLTLVLFVPVFALLLYILPLQKPRCYAEVLVFGFHYWTFLYLFVLGLAFLPSGISGELSELVFFAGLLGYLLVGLHHVYKRAWVWTVLCSVLVLFASFVLFATFMALLWVVLR